MMLLRVVYRAFDDFERALSQQASHTPREKAVFEQQYSYPLNVPEIWTWVRDVARFFIHPSTAPLSSDYRRQK